MDDVDTAGRYFTSGLLSEYSGQKWWFYFWPIYSKMSSKLYVIQPWLLLTNQ